MRVQCKSFTFSLSCVAMLISYLAYKHGNITPTQNHVQIEPLEPILTESVMASLEEKILYSGLPTPRIEEAKLDKLAKQVKTICTRSPYRTLNKPNLKVELDPQTLQLVPKSCSETNSSSSDLCDKETEQLNNYVPSPVTIRSLLHLREAALKEYAHWKRAFELKIQSLIKNKPLTSIQENILKRYRNLFDEFFFNKEGRHILQKLTTGNCGEHTAETSGKLMRKIINEDLPVSIYQITIRNLPDEGLPDQKDIPQYDNHDYLLINFDPEKLKLLNNYFASSSTISITQNPQALEEFFASIPSGMYVCDSWNGDFFPYNNNIIKEFITQEMGF